MPLSQMTVRSSGRPASGPWHGRPEGRIKGRHLPSEFPDIVAHGRLLSASAEIALASPQAILQRLCARFSGFCTVRLEGRQARIETVYGTIDLDAGDRVLAIEAEGADDVNLAYVKLAVAEHLLDLASAESPTLRWSGDGAAGAPLPYFRELRVVRAHTVTPRMRRLTLAGQELRLFESGGLHVRLLFPKAKDRPPGWPVTGVDGRPLWPGVEERPDVRLYTLRRVDAAAGEVDIDFVIHDDAHAPGAGFAAVARPGDVLGMTGPLGETLEPVDWLLLAGDEAALPAIARILQSLPPATRAVVKLEVADAGEEQTMPSAASVDIEWLHRSGPKRSGGLAGAVRAVSLPNSRRMFAWAGCEHADFRAIRSHWRETCGLDRDRHLAVAYWRRGSASDAARSADE